MDSFNDEGDRAIERIISTYYNKVILAVFQVPKTVTRFLAKEMVWKHTRLLHHSKLGQLNLSDQAGERCDGTLEIVPKVQWQFLEDRSVDLGLDVKGTQKSFSSSEASPSPILICSSSIYMGTYGDFGGTGLDYIKFGPYINKYTNLFQEAESATMVNFALIEYLARWLRREIHAVNGVWRVDIGRMNSWVT